MKRTITSYIKVLGAVLILILFYLIPTSAFSQGGCVTLYWAGTGSNISGGPSSSDFNTAANWSTNSSTYSASTTAPTSCNDVWITLKLDNTINKVNITVNSSTTIKSLKFTVKGNGAVGYTGVYSGYLDVGNAYFQIKEDITLNASTDTYSDSTKLLIESTNANSIIDYGGKLTTSAGSAVKDFVYPLFAKTNNQGRFIMRGNATLSGIGSDQNNKPASVVFDAIGAQTITNNNTSGTIYLGNTTTIGSANTPSVELAGSNASGFKSINSLSVKAGATLQIDASQSINANTTGGTFSLGANATMLLLGTGNFPSNYGTNTLDATSTVNYNAGGDQNVAAVTYGNLTFSSSGTKTAQGALSAAGNLTIQGAATFDGSGYIHTLSGNWINNSTGGFTGNASTITFTGSISQSITGSQGTKFYKLTINKTSTANTVTNSTSDKVFSVQDLTVTQGTLVLGAFNANYNITGNVIVSPTGVLVHSVPWDAVTIGSITYPGDRAIYVTGNLDITGIFTPTYRSHLSMNGTGAHTVQTGSNSVSTLSILTLSNGTFSTNGNLVTNQEVWVSWAASSSLTIKTGNLVAFPKLLVRRSGTVTISGGKLEVSGEVTIGATEGSPNAGTVNVSSGNFIVHGQLINGYSGGTGTLKFTGGTLTVDGNMTNDLKGTFTFSTTSIPVKTGGNFVNNGTFTAGNSTFTFQGTANQQISGSANIAFYNLEINGTNVQILNNISINNNLTLTKGIFDLQGFTANRSASGGTLSAASGSALQLSASTGGTGNSNFPQNFSTFNLNPASTVNYYGANQDIFDAPYYGNLIISNAGLKTASGNLTVQGNFTMQTGATFKAGNFTHTFLGNFTNNTSYNAFGYDNSNVIFSGTSAQNIGGSFGTSFNAFVMANSTGINLNKPVSIYESITRDAPGRVLNTNDNLTIKSLQTKTAYVGNMSGCTINGKATVERYAAARKAWRFVSVATTGGQTVKSAWQEGALTEGSDPTPGYGTQIPGYTANWASLGFDRLAYAPSIKYYDAATDSWIGVPNTNTTPISNVKGYMLFVRGDRLATDANSTPTQTTLRTKDNLKMGTQPAINVLSGKYESIGNPYASPIDFTKISKGSAISNTFYLWDPFLAGIYGLGGYQTFSATNDWKPAPGGTALYPTGVANSNIPSGQAFFVKGNAGSGSDLEIVISESSKVDNTMPIERPGRRQAESGFFRASLFNTSGLLLDGNAVAFNDKYSNNVDGDDALKFAMTGENFGMTRQGKSLVVEGRSNVSVNDTIYYKVSGLAKQNYRIAFAPENMDRTVQAILIDNYTKTNTDLSVTDTSWYDFNVNNDAASFAASRFSVVFRPMGTLPVTFGTIKAYQKSTTVIVEWKVYDEKNVKEYRVERSTDGTNFTGIGSQSSNNNLNGTYTFTDNQPLSGNNYYRIRNVDLDGNSKLSDIAKVNLSDLQSIIEVFPNPVVNNRIQVKFANQPEGTYQIELHNNLGQVMSKMTQKIGTGTQLISIPLSKRLNTGIYPMTITNDNGNKTTLNVIVK